MDTGMITKIDEQSCIPTSPASRVTSATCAARAAARTQLQIPARATSSPAVTHVQIHHYGQSTLTTLYATDNAFDDINSRQLHIFPPHKQKEREKPSIKMSMFFGQKPQVSSEQKIAQAEAEIDMVSDMYSR